MAVHNLLSLYTCISDDLMDRSFAMRREEIEAKKFGVNDLFSRFPFLQEFDGVSSGVQIEHTYCKLYIVAFTSGSKWKF